jgi:hypothetical protein
MISHGYHVLTPRRRRVLLCGEPFGLRRGGSARPGAASEPGGATLGSLWTPRARRSAEAAFGRLMKDKAFATRVAELLTEAAQGAVATARQVLEELTKIADALQFWHCI